MWRKTSWKRLGVLVLLLAAIALFYRSGKSPQRADEANGSFALAVSWQPAFCETEPRRRECSTQTPERFDAMHFSLHGLWPQPDDNVYCGVSQADIEQDRRGPWRALDVPRITQSVWDRVRVVMPGTRSNLHKHEWVKHGTCAGVDIDSHYARSLELMDDLNESSFRAFFADRIGERVSRSDILNAFKRSFGKSTGPSLQIRCATDRDSNRLLITELVFSLANPFAGNRPLGDLLTVEPFSTGSGCPGGFVDAAGFDP